MSAKERRTERSRWPLVAGLALVAAGAVTVAVLIRRSGPPAPTGEVRLAGREITVEFAFSDDARRTAFADRRRRGTLRPFLVAYPKNRYLHFFSRYPDLRDPALEFPHDVRIVFADLAGKVVDVQTLRGRSEPGVTSREEAAFAVVLPGTEYQDWAVRVGDRFERIGELAARPIGEMTMLVFPSGAKLDVELAIADPDRHRGLMHRARMSADDGMLFIFPAERDQGFYMKNTLFPLDLAYIAEDGTIDLIVRMDPQDESPHRSEKPARYVLEANAGWFGQHSVMVGERIEWPEAVRSILDQVE